MPIEVISNIVAKNNAFSGLISASDVIGLSAAVVTYSPPATINYISSINGVISSATNKTYVLDYSAADAYFIEEISIGTTSGSCSADFYINETPISGLDLISVSPVKSQLTALSNNLLNVDDTLNMVISNVSVGIQDLKFTIKTNKT